MTSANASASRNSGPVTAPTALLKLLLVLAALACGAHAQAQDAAGFWSVQTVALRDLREAQSTAAALKQRGFDAYTEFAMDAGLQFVRVRVGCFVDRAAAESMVFALRGRITDTAAVVEATPGAPVAGCVSMSVGFLKPAMWDEVASPGLAPAFKVQVAGIEAHVAHTGVTWRVLQDGEAVPPVDPALPTARFSQTEVAGVRLVSLMTPAGSVILCPGVLVTSVGNVAITEQGEALVACSLETMGGP